jgi:hypothetical protein
MNRTEMACATCHAPLNVLGDPPSYIHPLSLTTDGHQPVPVPAEQLDTIARRCDFCGDPHPVWSLHGGNVTVVALDDTGSGLAQDYGEVWAACVSCESLASAGDLDGLVTRAGTALGWRQGDEALQQIAKLHAAFLASRPAGRTLITTTAWPPTPMAARDLPKVRDRLVRLYRSSDQLPGPYANPQLRDDLADGLLSARLYWIDPEFTTLTEHAAGQLPYTGIDPDDPPAPSGLIVWAQPVTNRQVAAASWSIDGKTESCRIACYRSIGGGLDGAGLQRLREQVGWLAPTRLVEVTPRQTLSHDGPAAPLLATWLLIAQKAAEAVPVELDKATRRAYARQQRPAPEVRLVRIRIRTGGPARTGVIGGIGRGRAPLQEREWVGGHWKQQAYGPGRSQRRLTYVAAYLRGPDNKPIRASSTVRVLGSTRAPTPDPAK